METARGRVNSRSGGERAKANGNADAADGNDGGAGALENREDDAGPIEEPQIEKRGLRARGVRFLIRCRHDAKRVSESGTILRAKVATGDSGGVRRRGGVGQQLRNDRRAEIRLHTISRGAIRIDLFAYDMSQTRYVDPRTTHDFDWKTERKFNGRSYL